MALSLLPASTPATAPKIYTDPLGRQYTIDNRNGKKKYLSSGTTSLPAPEYGNATPAPVPSSGFSIPTWVLLAGGVAVAYFLFGRKKG